MTDDEIEDMNFRAYLEAKYYEALFEELDAALFMGTTKGDDETQARL